MDPPTRASREIAAEDESIPVPRAERLVEISLAQFADTSKLSFNWVFPCGFSSVGIIFALGNKVSFAKRFASASFNCSKIFWEEGLSFAGGLLDTGAVE